MQTHGGPNQAITFEPIFQNDNLEIYTNQPSASPIHKYTLREILIILLSLFKEFGTNWFDLHNQVDKFQHHNPNYRGLGVTIYECSPNHHNRSQHAQGASYLGPVLDSVGILEWNLKNHGIQWRLNSLLFTQLGIIINNNQITVDGVAINIGVCIQHLSDESNKLINDGGGICDTLIREIRSKLKKIPARRA